MDAAPPTREQEDFWKGEFGAAYSARNRGANWISANISFFSEVLRTARPPQSIIEFGANIGLNLQALHQLFPDAALHAVEINPDAAKELSALGYVKVRRTSLLDFDESIQCDLSMTKGVLIHIAPDNLPAVYDLLHRTSRRYICVAEYYNPSPVELTYRGHANKLFKRDFAGELMDRHPDVRLADYGFRYRRDPTFPQDDLTWFLLEKSGASK